ncbi:hypothetical protein [Blastomonas sp.]|uniref:hypothetical protein n=1 Tax=Blastomonas sp. TaxID=1909299 RepID=UPI00260F17BA|nr:hypothetical protein [Blastomonas sp.]MDM7956198.1 hypothetical protein [Blastomonas sp.]
MAFLSLLFVQLWLGDYRNRPTLARACTLPFFTHDVQKCPDAMPPGTENLVLPSQQG